MTATKVEIIAAPRLVFLESPFAGATDANMAYARLAMRHSICLGEVPFAGHLLYTQPGILDDTIQAERILGMRLGFAWAEKAAATVVYGDLGISDGMRLGIEQAAQAGRPVEIRHIMDNGRRAVELALPDAGEPT
jgi:hypothetical protein